MARKQQSLVEAAFSDLIQMQIDVTQLALAESAPSAETVRALAERLRADVAVLTRAINIAKRILDQGLDPSVDV